MGQKVNPIGVRLKHNRIWESNWYGEKNYGTYLIEDLRIRKFIENKILHSRRYARLELSVIKIRRIGKLINIYIYASRPGLLIGKKGQDIEDLRNSVQKIVDIDLKVNININEIKKLDLDANVVAQNIGKAIEGRVAYKRAMKQAIARSMKSGAKGVKIQVAGRLNGSDMARREYFKEGSIPLHTFDAEISYGQYKAITTYGIIGITVWIHKGYTSKAKFDSSSNVGKIIKN